MANNNDPSPKKFTSILKRKSLEKENKEKDSPAVELSIYEIDSSMKSKTRWILRGRVIQRSLVKRTSGQTFSCIFSDSLGSIKILFFDEESRKFDKKIVVGKEYQIENGVIEDSKYLNYTWVKNSYCVKINSSSIITVLDETIVPYKFNFSEICPTIQAGKLIDLLGILFDIPEAEKVGLSYKRVVELQDIEGNSARVTMWGEVAETFLKRAEELQNQGNSSVIIALSGLNVSPYGRRQDLNLVSYCDTIIVYNPDCNQGMELRALLKSKEDSAP